jgi:hypothetical protein
VESPPRLAGPEVSIVIRSVASVWSVVMQPVHREWAEEPRPPAPVRRLTQDEIAAEYGGAVR